MGQLLVCTNWCDWYSNSVRPFWTIPSGSHSIWLSWKSIRDSISLETGSPVHESEAIRLSIDVRPYIEASDIIWYYITQSSASRFHTTQILVKYWSMELNFLGSLSLRNSSFNISVAGWTNIRPATCIQSQPTVSETAFLRQDIFFKDQAIHIRSYFWGFWQSTLRSCPASLCDPQYCQHWLILDSSI